MATTASTTSVQKLYIAYFGRPADAAGLAFYADALDAGTTTVSAIATSFGASTEAATTVALSTSAYVSAVYLQAFGRAYDSSTDGTFWTDALTAGTTTKELAMVQILNGASGTDATAVTNKVAVANTYTVAVTTDSKTYSGATAIAAAKAVLSDVTATASTVTSGNTAAQTAVTALTVASAGTGETFTLTTGVDLVGSFTGGALDDTFIADNTATTDVTSTADTIAGGAGVDTFSVYSDGATFLLPAMTSIEVVNIYDQDDTVDISAMTSATSVNFIRGLGGATWTVSANAATLSYTNSAMGADTLFVHAAADTATQMTLDGITGSFDVNLDGAALVTHVVNTTGTASVFTNLDVDASTSTTINAGAKLTVAEVATTTASAAVLTLTGAGAVSITAVLDVGFDTVTATSHTGGLTALIGAAVDTVINLGSGDDVITASTEDALTAAHLLAVDGGAGTDTLLLAVATDIGDAIAGAHYTNFETLQTADTFDFDFIAGMTGLTVTGGTSKSYTNMTAAIASNVSFTGNNATSTIFSLKTATGTSDVLTITNDHATAATDVDLVGISAVGFETVNVTNNNGAVGGDATFGFLANKSDAVTALNFNGASDVTMTIVANTLDVVAADIDASGLTGTADITLVSTSSLLSGSTFKGSVGGADVVAIGTTNGTSYTTYAGNDTFTGALAALVATGSNDTSIDGGAGTDILSLSDATLTLTDNHFTNVSNMETLTGASTTGAYTVSTGTNFNNAFADGFTGTTGTIADGVAAMVNLQAGLSTVDMTFTADLTSAVGNAAGEDVTVVTGTGADTITLTGDDTWVGISNADAGSIIVDSGAGIDTISVTVGTILLQITSQHATINAGTGADLITYVGTAAAIVTSTVAFTVDAGDSLVTAQDKITGFDVSNGTLFGASMDFTGTSAIGTLTTSNDFGTIQSHSITAGVVLFDDAGTYGAELIINSANLADAVGYLAANSATLDAFVFEMDTTGNGVNDASMIYNNNTTDSLVELVGIAGEIDAVIISSAAGDGDILVL